MSSKEKLHQFFSSNFPFNEDGLSELINSFEPELYKKDQMILKPGTVELKLRFIVGGFVREFYDSGSKELNVNFFEANQFTTDLNSFFEGTQTSKHQQCLSDVNILALSKNNLKPLLAKHDCGHKIVQSSFQKALSSKESIERKKLTLSTEDLYKEIQIKKPNWLNSIPQYHIASYLNVSPETLSRIKKRIY